MATHSSTLDWKIPWTEGLVGCSPWGRRVGYDWATSLSLFPFMHWRRKWQPIPVFLPGKSQGWGAWWAAVYEVAQSRIRLKWLSNSSSSSSSRKLVWEQKWCGCPFVSLCPAYIASLCGGRTISHRGPCFSPGPLKPNVPISPRWGLFRSPSLIFSSLPRTGE